jgi:hypothetical protein
MSEPQVDFSAIRGDWRFHMNYVSNAISRTLTRELKYWDKLGGKSPKKELDDAVKRQTETWKSIMSSPDPKGSIRVEAAAINDFLAACRATREPCDAWVDQSAASPNLANLKEFAEACRQLRGLCDDVEMMRDQKPKNI